ncbi:MAG TPA: TonB-dependent receptor [Oligoflexus sp.]|uniref:TonB-dependent receptor family protein n=1 Tax=Oligoflexus sp. TaxID=1971216 RepID=UPI002D800A06|nr:TonB-dependent receptor [Oligoflexus sp.]HET9238345.1 TonB-dependent receptor [Oligoflexus sp.]
MRDPMPLVLVFVLAPSLFAQEKSQENITVHGTSVFLEPGSTTVIGVEQLETYKYTDLNRVLKTVPGVQIQEEDGFGLRPNIGMRGVAPHRSRKVLIMEDGIPSGPAPYAAPAAYYVPTMTTIENVEVTKGSSAVRYGPQTVGGAINLITKRIPEEPFAAQVEVAQGSFEFKKALAQVGGKNGAWGWSILGAQMESAGFKTLTNGHDTGFHKRDLLGKLSYELTDSQQLLLKAGWSDELSDESYLGLTKADFEADPYQRYAASERDQMKNGHRTLAFSHEFRTSEILSVVTLYNHGFDRLWKRFDGVSDRSVDIRSVLANPVGQNAHIYDVITGRDDSLGTSDLVLQANNHRSYYSRGLNWDGQYLWKLSADTSNQLEWGLRFHQDSIRHDHTSDTFAMINGHLEPSGEAQGVGAQDRIKAEAWSAFVWDTYTLGDWRLSGGLRQEWVTIEEDDFSAANEDAKNKRAATMPGLGVFKQINPNLGWLLGVYRGMGLAAADDKGSGKAEESINYESGFRFMQGSTLVDLIGYWNDYRNIKGTCSVSEGCGAATRDISYDGGKARIYGFELTASHGFRAGSLQFPTSFQYTLTRASFDGNFVSGLTDWGLGEIQKGDPIPYVPRHQLGIQAGMRWEPWLVNFQWKRQSSSYDQALAAGRETLPASSLLDASVSVTLAEAYELYATADNITNEKVITSFRPFGARPGKPQAFVFGAKAKF